MPSEIFSAVYISGALAAVAAAAALVGLCAYLVRRRLPQPVRARRAADARAAAESEPQQQVSEPSRKAPEANDDGTSFTVPSTVCISSASPGSQLGYLRHRGYRQEPGVDRSVQQSDHSQSQKNLEDVNRKSEPTHSFPPVKDASATHVCPEGGGEQSHPRSSSRQPNMCPVAHVGAASTPHSACPWFTKYDMDTGSKANQSRAGPHLDNYDMDDDLVATFCPFGFGGNDMSGDEMSGDESGDPPRSTTVLSASVLGVPSSRAAEMAEQHHSWMDDRSRLVELNQQRASSDCNSQAEGTGQRLTTSQKKEALRTAPAQLSADEKAAEEAACKEQLTAILELMKKQDGVFSQEDFDGVTSQLNLYM